MSKTDYKSIANKLKFEGSGSLSRDQGTEALNQYLQTKTIWISHS